MKQFLTAILLFLLLPVHAWAAEPDEPFLIPQGEASLQAGEESFDIDGQLDAVGRGELMQDVPEGARELMEEAEVYDLSIGTLLQLSPREFFRAIWDAFVQQAAKPVRTLGVVTAVIILCAMLSGLGRVTTDKALGQMFTTVAVLCILTSVITPILDCIIDTSTTVREAATFMLTFIPIYAASMTAAGQPVTGATYNMFLFSTCQVVSQVVAQTLIPLMGIYLALCVVGVLVPDIKISSATAKIKSIVSWTLGFIVTIFVGLLSIQTMVTGGADNVTTRAAKFLIGSFVPVVGGALSEAFSAAQGCLRLIKTTVGAYGIIVALFTFLPILIQTVLWYGVTGIAGMAGDVLGVSKVSEVMKSCSSVLGILIAIILCFALLIIVSTAVVMVTGMGAA